MVTKCLSTNECTQLIIIFDSMATLCIYEGSCYSRSKESNQKMLDAYQRLLNIMNSVSNIQGLHKLSYMQRYLFPFVSHKCIGIMIDPLLTETMRHFTFNLDIVKLSMISNPTRVRLILKNLLLL
jgi:hypothetical protein